MSGQGAGTQAALMPAAMNLRLQTLLRARPDIQRADAFGAVDLVRRKRHQVHRPLRQVDRHFARALSRVDMEQRPASRTSWPMAAISLTVPSSLLTSISETRKVSSRMRFADRLRA